MPKNSRISFMPLPTRYQASIWRLFMPNGTAVSKANVGSCQYSSRKRCGSTPRCHPFDGIHRLQPGHQFAAGEDLDLELAAGRFGYAGEDIRCAEDGIEALREARRQAPLDGQGTLGECRCSCGADGQAAPVFSERNDAPYSLVSSGFTAWCESESEGTHRSQVQCGP